MTLDRSPEVRPAGFVTRLVAFFIDQIILATVVAILTAIVGIVFQSFRLGQLLGTGDLTLQLALIPLGSASILLNFAYYVGFWLLAGQTPGKAALGVAVVRADGSRLRAGAAIARWLGYWLSGIFFLGYLWILADNRRQGWHDKLARTLVVYCGRDERGLSISGQVREYLQGRQRRVGAAETTRPPGPEE
ncbi:MAG: RDD family protein [Anaerolineae bacterium]|jgi:uncharacterized RDD family membrane protein YckC